MRLRLVAVAAVAAVAMGCSCASAHAATGNEKYTGETEDGRKVKLVADERGEVLRGAITAETDCTGQYEPFRARVDFGAPLDRSGPGGFRDKGSFVENDDRFSARYRYKVEAERAGKRAFSGTLDLEIVFRRNGAEYTSCSVEHLVFSAERTAEFTPSR